MSCMTPGCKQPSASETFPDLVGVMGMPCRYSRCVAHEIQWHRERIAELTYHDSQLTAAALAAGIPTGEPW